MPLFFPVIPRSQGGTGVSTTPAAPAVFSPANPTGTASASLVHMGLGATCFYTPASSGNVLVTVTGVISGTAAATGGIGGRYGTLAAPVANATTVAAGSNGAAAISTIASWAQPSAGVLDVAATTGYAASGTVWVQTSVANQPAQISYTSVTGGGTPSFNGCAFVAGTGANTVATSNTVAPYPLNGATVAGTRFSGASDPAIAAGVAASRGGGFALTSVLALTAGTSYWFDLVILSGSGTASLLNVSMTFTELS